MNRKVEAVVLANAVSAGVSNSLDLTLGQGKGKVLERFADLMLGTKIQIKKNRRPALSDRAASFFGSLPVRKRGAA